MLCLFFSITTLIAQNPVKIVYLHKINYTDLPFLNDLTNNKNAAIKENYNYLNRLSFDSLVYTSDGLKILAYVIKPNEGINLPCIIFNHGGNRNFGNLSPELMIRFLSKLASNGFVVIASSYRGNAKSEGQDEFCGKDINDVLNLMDVLEQFPQADTTKIGMYGWSRGGLMTYIALTKTKKIKTAVIGGSPTSMSDLIKERPLFEKKVLMQTIPGYSMNKQEELYKRSPVEWAEKFPKIPLLIIHGANDDRVSAVHALNISKSLLKQEIPHRLVIYENADHTIKEHREELLDLVIEWFNANLK